MRFKVDENLPVEIAACLRAAGHQADTTRDQGLTGADDSELAARLLEERRVIVTCDLHFGDIRNYPPRLYPGIIVLRPKPQGKRALLALTKDLVPLLASEPLAGKLWIAQRGRLRVFDA